MTALLNFLSACVRPIRGTLGVMVLFFAFSTQILGLSEAQANFFDDFDRVDDTAIGFGWIEKSEPAFSLSGGQAAKQVVATFYRNNLVYRPASEDVVNAEASVEFQLTSLPTGYPQIFVRAQSDTIDVHQTMDAYILFVNNSATQAVLGRQLGRVYTTELAYITISPGLNATDTYRLRLSAMGTDPVELTAYVERLNVAV